MANLPLLHQEALGWLLRRYTDEQSLSLREACRAVCVGEGFLKEVAPECDKSQLGEEQEKEHSNSRNSICRDTEHETGSF